MTDWWHTVTREEFDKEYPPGRPPAQGFPPWRICNWKERTQIIIIQIICWLVVFPAMLFGALFLLGAMIDAHEQNASQLRSCQKHASTPYEYHQCR